MKLADGYELDPAVPLDDLRPHPKNPNQGDVGAIVESIETVGFYGVVIAQKPNGKRQNGRILAGEHRWRAAKEEGAETIPVCWVDVDDADADRILLGDNQIARLALMDQATQAAMLQALAGTEKGLGGTGTDSDDLDNLLENLAEQDNRMGSPADDTPPEDPPDQAVTQAGDVWILGAHRLMCGDSLETPANLDTLLQGQPVDLVLTDPPYAIYGSSTGVSSDIADDKMIRPFFASVWVTIRSRLAEFGHAYVHCDWRSWSTLWATCTPAGMVPKNMLVWDKGGAGLGSNYANTHELIFFAHNLPTSGTMTSGRKSGIRSVNGSNVLRHNRPTGDERQHNAAKPIEMLADFIANSSEAGGTVLDMFSGSGSTLIAAENMGRAARCMEVSPAMCDVIARRFQKHTGTVPILEATNQPHDFT